MTAWSPRYPPGVPTSDAEKPRKFTMLVSDDDDERARKVVDDVVKRAGIRTTKSMRADVVRALFAVAEHDTALREKLAEKLKGSA